MCTVADEEYNVSSHTEYLPPLTQLLALPFDGKGGLSSPGRVAEPAATEEKENWIREQRG